MAGGTLVVMLVLVFSSVPVAAVLGVLSLGLDVAFMDGRLTAAIGEFTWDKSKEFILVAVPMFILLGEIMLRAGIAQRMYNAVVQWLSFLPGGLMHANIGSCAIFAASSGSSVATAATVGTVAYPEIEKRNYNEPLFLGTLAAGGTLGILIPPSINLILYGASDRHLGSRALPGGHRSRCHPGVVVHADHHRRLSVSQGLGRHQGRDVVGRAHPDVARPAAADPALLRRRRFDLRRHRDADRGGIDRCRLRPHDRRLATDPQHAHAA